MSEQKLIDQLTPEQQAMIPEFRERYTKYALNTNRIDHEAFKETVNMFRRYLKLPDATTFIFGDSPNDCYRKALAFEEKNMSSLKKQPAFTGELSKEKFVNAMNYGNIYSFWLCFYDFVNHVVDNKFDGDPRLFENLAKNCHLFWLYPEAVVYCDFPTIYSVNKEFKLSSLGGPTIQYSDGEFTKYIFEDVEVNPAVVLNPSFENAALIQDTAVREKYIEALKVDYFSKIVGQNTTNESGS